MLTKARLFLGIAVVVALVVGAFSVHGSNHSFARGATGSLAEHPAVGTWAVDTGGEASVFAFTSDGVMFDTEQDGSSGVGSWDAKDDSTATFTLVILNTDEGNAYSLVVRGEFAVDDSGDAASLTYSLTVLGTDGTVLYSESGAADAQGGTAGHATRIPVEGPEIVGTPISGFPVFASTPAA